MSQHTAGPWEAMGSPDCGLPYNISCRAGYIAEVGALGDGRQGREHQANARLIAAAPDLLREGTAIICAIDEQRNPSDALAALRAAIAKAEKGA